MKNRLKAVRKSLSPKISQEKFGDMLGVSRNAIKTYELGTVVPSDTFIQLLCSKFNINEDWLRTGVGDMLIESDDSIFTSFAEKYNLTKAEQNVARYCLQLTSAQRAEILNHVVNVAEILKTTPSIEEPKLKTVSDNIDQEVSDYRQELEAEQRAQLVYENSDEIKKAK